MLTIGLTGGIGSGKSLAASMFEALDVPVIDMDVIAKSLLTSNPSIINKVITYFGDSILLDDGVIDRKKLRLAIIENAEKRRWLEDLLHPIIIDEAWKQVKLLDAPYCIVVIPLLVEANLKHLTDRVLVIDAPFDLQLKRIVERDNMTEEQAKQFIGTQASKEERLAVADDVIVNDGSVFDLKQKILKIHDSFFK